MVDTTEPQTVLYMQPRPAPALSEAVAFASSLSHDIRSPVNTMVNFSELALDIVENEHPLRSHVERVHAGSVRLARLIDGLIQLGAAVQASPKLEEINLHLAVADAVRTVNAAINMEVGDPQTVLCDAEGLGLVLQSVLLNAMEFTAEGDEPVIRIRTANDGPMAVVLVTDEGIGFDSDSSEEMFEPFRRLHSRAIS